MTKTEEENLMTTTVSPTQLLQIIDKLFIKSEEEDKEMISRRKILMREFGLSLTIMSMLTGLELKKLIMLMD
jgi:hypothetical protein